MDLFVIDKTIAFSKWILESLGYTVFTGAERVIGVDGTGGLWIGDNCNGVDLFELSEVQKQSIINIGLENANS